MPRSRPVALLLAVAALLAAASAAVPPAYAGSVAAAAAPSALVHADVVGDDENDLYRGTGGLIVPESSWRSDGPSRQDVAGCADCEWRITRLCTKDAQANGGCRRLDVGCPVGTIPVRVWLRHDGGDWVVVGRTCQGDGAPRTVTDVGTEVTRDAVRLLPPLRARVQPAGPALVHVPVIGRTGQPARGIRGADLSVLGVAVSLDARVRWRWSWDDGDPDWYDVPGGRYPDTAVSHTYATAGTHRIGVTSVWRAQFTVEGLGPFDVPGGPLTQDAAVTVVVRESRAVLTG
ncbi:MAG: hypothetical protein U0S36_01220 [Candidatus Nanopelagicales bacterium]